DVDVRPAITIHVTDDYAQPKGDLPTVNARPGAHVGEVAVAVVVKQLVSAQWVTDVARVAHAEAGHRPRRVVDEKHVEAPVIVVVKEDGLGRVALIGESVLLGHLFKVRDAL